MLTTKLTILNVLQNTRTASGNEHTKFHDYVPAASCEKTFKKLEN